MLINRNRRKANRLKIRKFARKIQGVENQNFCEKFLRGLNFGKITRNFKGGLNFEIFARNFKGVLSLPRQGVCPT